ncbi:tRNA (N6-isopentenyl adenosine(37)-C2)-methylthiotransferase MiaB, partial [Candidatus Bipolaricaulota bacterium]|nr:tRNA (N6-isopentenyl adenosine(37)-C2)-methylthiotransferase MiaB [Candidatus Bipolaricaulota bacterium]
MKKHLYIETWGCQMNLHQSEGIAGLLEERGLSLTDSLDDADVVIFNTCLVRQKAEEKVYGRIGAVAQ